MKSTVEGLDPYILNVCATHPRQSSLRHAGEEAMRVRVKRDMMSEAAGKIVDTHMDTITDGSSVYYHLEVVVIPEDVLLKLIAQEARKLHEMYR